MSGYAVAKFDYDFNCPSYLSTNGVDFTLHPDKAQRFDTFEAALRWHRANPDTTIRSFPKGYERY